MQPGDSLNHNVQSCFKVNLLDQKTNPRLSVVSPGSRDLTTFDDQLDWRDEPEARLGAQLLSLWRIFSKWRWLILSSVVAGLLLGVVATLLTTPIYRGTATIQIERDAPKIVNVQGLQSTQDIQGPEFFQTQYGLLKSYSLAERVARNLKLADDPTFLPRSRSSNGATAGSLPQSVRDQADRTESVIGMVMGGLSVDPVRESKLVKVSFDSPNPTTAARVANAVTANFIQANLERRYEASSFARAFLESRLSQVRQKLEDSERELAAYATSQEII